MSLVRLAPLVAVLATFIGGQRALARPDKGLGAGTRALVLDVDRERGRVAIGDLQDQLVVLAVSATVAGGRVVVAPDFGPATRTPTRWRIDIERTNRLGVTTARELPILGVGLPPVAVLTEVQPRDEHVRVQLTMDFGRFDGATSAPVFVPPLPAELPAPPAVATLTIDGKDARLPVDHERMTFDLDVPATVVLRVEDAHGTRWMRRAISAAKVTRPTSRARPSPVKLDAAARVLRVSSAVVPLPDRAPRVLRGGLAGDGIAWAALEPAAATATSWRVRFGDGAGARLTRFGAGALPIMVSVPAGGRLTWVEVEQTTDRGVRVVSGRAKLDATLAQPVVPSWVIAPDASAGDVVRVGTSTGAHFLVGVPDDL